MLTETIAASSGVLGLPTLGAPPRLRAEVSYEGLAGPCTAVIGAPVTSAVTAGAVLPASPPAPSGRGLAGLARFLELASAGSEVFGETTVRKQHTYMTRVIANGEDAAGPHRRRAPV